MLRIVQLEGESLIAEVRRPPFAHDRVEYAKTSPGQVVERLAGAAIAITNKVAINAAAIDALPDLKMIAVSATGTNNVDLDACRARGIVVSNIRGYAEHTVPEHVMALLLALSRNLIAWRETLQAGGWQRAEQFCLFDHPIRDLHGATLGLIGSGTLGNGVARLAEAFGMCVLRAERKGAMAVRPGYTAFAEVLAEADAISLHCPLTAETTGLIAEPELRAMKRSALLINTARGGIVDEAALVRALKEGWIAGAGFDVLTAEPPPAGHPMVDPTLLALPNFLLTPHVAWSSRPAMQTLADQLIDNIEAFVAGAPRNRVA
ncbi:D-2-hydroxyacid dehydrogenase [Ferribacterium limneticum]|uniref:D-2-hydroxyacid dehydrogenase n=1 Tax=Ferribacterium limneticum TaxID=76259 RepID=UPI001CFABB4B|nr:D-2-hydroxyacid dehydrogenase [Ferribacterium limneticum]UCV27751.1 D-2-hydroxyacid dehydrogenase [Ferribacterium limneticum]UCV31668.1 D-2-hydroxyacid dehydrogenase [Ferribacterium limneticum]